MGIKTIQQRSEERKNAALDKTPTRELWLSNGDDARVSILTEEKEDSNGNITDPYFSYFYVRRATDDNGFNKKYFLAEKRDDVPQEYLDKKVVGEQIGFWVYAYYVLHETNVRKGKTMTEWKEVKRGNVVRYREEINDFRIYMGGLGQKRSFEGDLNSIAIEVGALESNIIRLIKQKTGDQAIDVVYKAKETADKTDIPNEKKAMIKDLPTVIEYAKEHLVEYVPKKLSSVEETTEDSSSEDTESLF